jgi:hypothetical protein
MLLLWLGAVLENDIAMTIFSVIAAIVSLAMILLAVWGSFALAYGVIHIEEKLSLWQIYSKSIGRIFPLIWTSILIMALIIPGMAAFIIPGIIILVWFSMATYICLDDGTWGLAALWRSKELVKGCWWSVIARYMTIQALMLIFIYAFMYLMGTGGALLGLLSAALGTAGVILMGIGMVIFYVLYFVVLIVLSLFSQVYMAQVYQSLKETKGKLVVNENKTTNTLIIIWVVILLVGIPLLFIFGLVAAGGLVSMLESMDSAGFDDLFSLFNNQNLLV